MPGRNEYYWRNREERKAIAIKHTELMNHRHSSRIQQCVKEAKIYNSFNEPENCVEKTIQSEIIVCDMDSVSALYTYGEGKTAVLNFASYTNPGGKFIEGSQAQEESLCHASILYNVLKEFPEYYEWNAKHRANGMYLNRAIYTPNIVFDISDKKPAMFDVITCAAPNLAPVIKYGNMTKKLATENTETLWSRINFIYNIANDQKVDTLILGAFGCGVFCQDPHEVANIFIELIEKFNFKKIVFAIPIGVNKDNYFAFIDAMKEHNYL